MIIPDSRLAAPGLDEVATHLQVAVRGLWMGLVASDLGLAMRWIPVINLRTLVLSKNTDIIDVNRATEGTDVPSHKRPYLSGDGSISKALIVVS